MLATNENTRNAALTSMSEEDRQADENAILTLTLNISVFEGTSATLALGPN